jgi:hypothetical protein
MKLVITDTIFDEFAELVLGVVTLHHIDNSQNRVEITEMLRQAEAALSGKFGSTPIIEHPAHVGFEVKPCQMAPIW